MKVAMYYSNSDIRIQEMPVPKIGKDELLLKVEASGICGSDVMEWYRVGRVPLVLGHEVAGVITEVGKSVKKFKVGDRVAAAHHVPCGKCHYCKTGHETVCDTLRKTNFDPGGFAQFIRIPAINVKKGIFPLPKKVSFIEGTFVEPLACVLRSYKLMNFRPKKTVLVLGSGISGILHVQLSKVYGAKKVIATDISPYRLNLAKKFGADFALSAYEDIPKEIMKVNDGRLADYVILCAGSAAAINQGFNSLERGGTMLFFAAATQNAKFELDINKIFWRNEITLTSSYAGSPQDCSQALGLIMDKRVHVLDMVTHKLKLDEIKYGFKLVAEAKESLKVIIEPGK